MSGDPLAHVLDNMSSGRLLVLFFTSGLSFLAHTLLTYTILYVAYLRDWAWWKRPPAILLGVSAAILIRAFLEQGLLYWVTGQGNYRAGTSWTYYVTDNTYYAILYGSIGIIYFYVGLSNHNRMIAQGAELLRREAELKFLRSQINPHFLFNTLNGVYSLVESGSDRALFVIERLSSLLRYSVYEVADSVSLGKEIDYLVNLIELENLRLPPAKIALFRLGTFSREWSVAPMLFAPFVENAFKHGSGDAPGPIAEISIGEQDRALVFRVHNTKRKGASWNVPGGVGVSNVRQRLSLLYPDRHDLSIEDTATTYTVVLTLRPDSTPRK